MSTPTVAGGSHMMVVNDSLNVRLRTRQTLTLTYTYSFTSFTSDRSELVPNRASCVQVIHVIIISLIRLCAKIDF